MLDEFGTPATFWGEAAYAAVVILNKTNVRVNNTQTPHELWYGETPSVKHFKIFGRKCYIKNIDEQLGKLEPRADEGILLGYSLLTIILGGGVNQYYLILLPNLSYLYFELFLHTNTINNEHEQENQTVTSKNIRYKVETQCG